MTDAEGVSNHSFSNLTSICDLHKMKFEHNCIKYLMAPQYMTDIKKCSRLSSIFLFSNVKIITTSESTTKKQNLTVSESK